MVRVIKKTHRALVPFDIPGATVQVSDPIVSKGDNLAAGFTEYTAPSQFVWTFTYDEVFFLLAGALEVHICGAETYCLESGDMGYIEKGTQATIVVPESAYLLHVTQPARQS